MRSGIHVKSPKDVTVMGKVDSVHVELRGLCNTCQRKKLNYP